MESGFMTLRVPTPSAWQRRGLVLGADGGDWGSVVVGDPCVVFDEDDGLWRMFLFLLPPGHGHASSAGDPADPRSWRAEGPLVFTNPEAVDAIGAFKPFVVLDASRPARAARIGGLYCLLLVTDHRGKVVRRAWSHRLAGPWTVEAEVLIDRGGDGDFDAKHVDAVSAWAFEDRGEVLYFYMGYPSRPQPHPLSPLGSCQGAAVESLAAAAARARATMSASPLPPPSLRKLGSVLAPSATRGHWASGWVGGLQLLRGREHRWVALVNASPTAPRADDDSISAEEPPPSLGGFAYTNAEFPVSGWEWSDTPIEKPADVPAAAREAGEVVNFWRHYAVVLDDGRVALFYTAGDYFHEKLFLRVADAPG
jgi:hypothetical protein